MVESDRPICLRCPGIAETDPDPKGSLLNGGRRAADDAGVMVAKAEKADNPAEGLREPFPVGADGGSTAGN